LEGVSPMVIHLIWVGRGGGRREHIPKELEGGENEGDVTKKEAC